MPVRVVDASALGALVFGEPKAEVIARILGDSPMAAPALIWFEVASICLRKIKAHPAQREQILRAFMMAGKLAIEIVEVDHCAVVNLAAEAGLTTYDPSYLWLARHLNGELITLDGKMQRAAKSL
ncbi:MAG: type II toxin-antitoxin system VapC family toxin [Deltaproteobacteria bacterium]|nr:type II toxin-antitoxin system VapC family toxin [Deltaproteobacteria bacterium]